MSEWVTDPEHEQDKKLPRTTTPNHKTQTKGQRHKIFGSFSLETKQDYYQNSDSEMGSFRPPDFKTRQLVCNWHFLLLLRGFFFLFSFFKFLHFGKVLKTTPFRSCPPGNSCFSFQKWKRKNKKLVIYHIWLKQFLIYYYYSFS